jgi:hypothetical protein
MAARNPRLAKIHIARKELALDDGAYRAMLHRLTGQSSSADCSDAQLDAVLEEFKAKGWKPSVVAGSGGRRPATHKPRRAAAEHPVARKARAMWISLGKLGAVRNTSEQALEVFAKRQVGCDAMRFMDQGQGFRLIEALKVMAERAGWSQDVGRLTGREAGELLQRRLDALLEARGAR